jgi:hypothetical protein
MFPWWGWAIAACCRSRAWLVAENLCLRQQLHSCCLSLLRRLRGTKTLNSFCDDSNCGLGSAIVSAPSRLRPWRLDEPVRIG